MGRYCGFVAMLFVVAACAGGEVSTEVTSSIPDAVTTTELLVATSTTSTTTTTTTLPVEVNLATAEAVVAAIYAGDSEALDELPWADPDGRAKDDAVGFALFKAALNVTVLDSSCEGETAEVVACQTQASDDLSDALGVGVFTDTHEISFDDSGAIFWLISETQDGGVVEVFTNWAWNIAYPGICASPAQCAEALLGVVDEYNETYPGAVVASYVAAYNAADIEAIVELFDEDAVIANHPGGTFTGTEQIRSLHEGEADGTVSYTISNLEVIGNTVTWDHVWSGEEDNGEPFQNCVEGHTAIVENGQIVSWTWPPTDFQC